MDDFLKTGEAHTLVILMLQMTIKSGSDIASCTPWHWCKGGSTEKTSGRYGPWFCVFFFPAMSGEGLYRS